MLISVLRCIPRELVHTRYMWYLMEKGKAVFSVRRLSRIYKPGDVEVHALVDVSLDIDAIWS